jgi:tetratricopeptide (TPR) repeat protein
VAKSEKMTQRELKQPDAFQRIGAEAGDWLIERQSMIAIAAGVLLLGGLGVALFTYFSNRGEAKAAQELGAALEILDRQVVAGDSPPLAMPGQKPPFKSTQEQDQALAKALTDFRASHKGTQAATMAALPLGKAEYRLGNHDGALAAFGEFLKGVPQNDPLRASALEGEGYAYEAQKKYDEALKSFESMTSVDAGGYLAGMGQYHRARILILQGKKDDAAAVLVKIPVDHKDTAAARLASERTALLASEGVKIPPPPAPPATAATDGGT